LYYVFLTAKKGQLIDEEDVEKSKSYPIWLSTIFILGGLAVLVFGGDLIVKHASEIARGWGMSETIIGFTIVAVGTSLPELATSLMAAYKGNSDIAVGNVVGSCIFNVFFILGVSAVIKPLPFDAANMVDAIIAAGATALVLFFGFKGRGQKIDKVEGVFLFVPYVIYVVYLLNG
jgi:cation:H+ antiporter